jgi:aromatic-L-amino-acid decarboxylase
MGTNPSYLRTAQDAEVNNFRDWGIPLGRRFRSLKLWFLLMDQGVDGLQARLRRDLAHAQWLQRRVEEEPGWELLAPVPLQTLCVRHVPPSLAGDEAALAAHNLEIAGRINQAGRSYLTPAVLKGRQMIRVSIGAAATELEDVERLWEDLRTVSTS